MVELDAGGYAATLNLPPGRYRFRYLAEAGRGSTTNPPTPMRATGTAGMTASSTSPRLIADRAGRRAQDHPGRATTGRVGQPGILEQAKGIVAQSGDLDIYQAFVVLRRYARDHNLKLTALARTVVSREIRPELVLTPPRLGAHRKRGR
jgi:hypothetical protein